MSGPTAATWTRPRPDRLDWRRQERRPDWGQYAWGRESRAGTERLGWRCPERGACRRQSKHGVGTCGKCRRRERLRLLRGMLGHHDRCWSMMCGRSGREYGLWVLGDMWTTEEDALILDGVARFGQRWRTIVELLPGRTVNAVRNRYLRCESQARTEFSGGGRAPQG